MKTTTQTHDKTNKHTNTSQHTDRMSPIFVPVAAAALAGLMMTSCSSTSPRSSEPAGPLVDVTPPKRLQERIKGVQVISVNGQRATRDDARIATGYNDVKVRFDWPQGGSQQVALKFKASPNRRYYVSMDPYPPTHDQTRGTTETGNAASVLANRSFGMMESRNPAVQAAGFVPLAPAIVLGAADKVYRVKETIREHHSAALHVDVMVVSQDNAEGVVRRVRAYPSGRVEWRTWDQWSNAPATGSSRRARPENRPADSTGERTIERDR